MLPKAGPVRARIGLELEWTRNQSARFLSRETAPPTARYISGVGFTEVRRKEGEWVSSPVQDLVAATYTCSHSAWTPLEVSSRRFGVGYRKSDSAETETRRPRIV